MKDEVTLLIKSVCTMKSFKSVLAIISALLLMSGCSAAYYSSVNAGDGMYGIHDKIAIANQQRERAELQRAREEARRAEAEAREAQWNALLAEAQAKAAEEEYLHGNTSELNYVSIVADSYESAYARRLQGFRSPSYRLPSSYYDFRYGEAYSYATAYDPAFYNIMVSGDQVWVEPKYISSMFGSWGATNVTIAVGNWYYGWASPYYYNYSAWWGYPRYSWWDWNWHVCYNPYHSWWGYGWGPSWGWHNHYWGWGGYYPHYHGVGRPPHHHPGLGHGSHQPRREQIVNRPSYTSPSSGKSFGNRAPARGSVNGSGIFDRKPSQGSSTNRGSVGVRSNYPSRSTNTSRGTTNRNQSGSSSFFNYNSQSSSSRNNSSSPSSGRSSFGSGSSSSSSSGGGHRGGNSLGR